MTCVISSVLSQKGSLTRDDRVFACSGADVGEGGSIFQVNTGIFTLLHHNSELAAFVQKHGA